MKNEKYYPAPKAGETWYIKLKGAGALVTRSIEKITPLVVKLKDHDRFSCSTAVYERADIKFVEIITK